MNHSALGRLVLAVASSLGLAGACALLARGTTERTVPTHRVPPVTVAPEATDKLGPVVRIDCKHEPLVISPLIYGIAHGDGSAGETLRRIGGNAMSRLNWELGNVWNTGNDWYFENVHAETGLWQWLEEAQAAGKSMALTVPMLGWVAKDGTSVGFPVSRFGRQRKHDPLRPEAGDGFSADGRELEPGPPTLTSEPAPPERIEGWVRRIRERDARSAKRSVALYLLDNEPDLWHKTHRDVHPEPISYDELLERTLRYAQAIRNGDPEATIAGPSSWGWPAYFTSAKDIAAGGPLQRDRLAHGGVPLLPWYLGELQAHELRSGVRLLNVLNVHYYPQAPGVYGQSAATDPVTAALRLRATRSLWDPDYRDESWIGTPVRLLPRLKAWTEEHYPGTRFSLGEWSFGAEQHISGGLATAEALGRFGQHGLYAAAYWRAPPAGSATHWAFRAFRNYDGRRARFLELSLRASSPEPISAFASRSEDGSRYVVILINRDAERALQPVLDVSSCGSLRRERMFRYSASTSGIELVERLETGSPNTTDATRNPVSLPAPLAAYSLAIIELSAPPQAP